ncbi:hypothetical protein NDU88_005025 [Pleurodeles waltl]|uniref:C-type lectin domain-containing protein n=1 Tax=Pleurodeles waltl TaxID=8319 RepID=A0AAV7V343_PLEWA|nr:hypothetical protein NDU88_005025 [Pleurodeles waltl]
MLEGRGSPDKELLKEGSVTEDHTSIRRRPQVPLKTSSGEEETRGRKRLPPTVTISSRVLMMLLCCVCTLPLLLAICALTGRFSSQDIPVPPHLEPCPMDWLHSRNKCYYFSTMYKEEGDWDESQKFCSSHNGSLALFDNEEQLATASDDCSVLVGGGDISFRHVPRILFFFSFSQDLAGSVREKKNIEPATATDDGGGDFSFRRVPRVLFFFSFSRDLAGSVRERKNIEPLPGVSSRPQGFPLILIWAALRSSTERLLLFWSRRFLQSSVPPSSRAPMPPSSYSRRAHPKTEEADF